MPLRHSEKKIGAISCLSLGSATPIKSKKENKKNLGLPEPGQGGKEEKSRGELSGQTGGSPPGWQAGLEPSLQIFGLFS